MAPHPLLNATPVNGACDVVIFHRRHDLTLARLSLEDIRRVIEEWCSIYSKRGSQENVKYVQIFEVRYVNTWLRNVGLSSSSI